MSVDWTDEADAAAALRARGVESDLSDEALHAYALAAVAEIAARGVGPGAATVRVDGWGQRLIALSPPAPSLTTVTEAGVTLTATAPVQYRLRPGGHFLERIADGYPSAFRGEVVVTYPHEADDRYDRVVTDLVKLALEYSGLDSRRDGDYAEESMGARGGGGQRNYQSERDVLISELAPDPAFA